MRIYKINIFFIILIFSALILFCCDVFTKKNEADFFDEESTKVSYGMLNWSGSSDMTSCKRILIKPDGRNVYVYNLYNNAILNFPRDPESGVLFFTSSYANPYLGNTINFLEITPDGKFIYVLDNSGNLYFYTINQSNGDLAICSNDKVLTAMSGPFVISKDGKNLYINYSSAFYCFGRSLYTGELFPLQSMSPAAPSGYKNSPDARFIYSSGAQLNIYERNMSDGTIKNTSIIPDSFNQVDISPDGRFLYGMTMMTYYVYSRNVNTGTISFLFSESPPVDSLLSFVLSQDGRNLYAFYNYSGIRIKCFLIDKSTGLLQDIGDAYFSESNVTAIYDALISPDGNAFYVLYSVGGDDKMGWFYRNIKR